MYMCVSGVVCVCGCVYLCVCMISVSFYIASILNFAPQLQISLPFIIGFVQAVTSEK